jgi:hypothetical protein
LVLFFKKELLGFTPTGISFDARTPSLRACEAGVAIHLSSSAGRQELDCFVGFASSQ